MTIRHDHFPRQSVNVGKKVLVCLDNDLGHILTGMIVRQDENDRHGSATIILLCMPEPIPGRAQSTYVTDRYIMGHECQFQIIK